MRFGFVNNFAAQIVGPLTETATEVELSTGADVIATLLGNADAVSLTLFATDSQGNETKREIVYATAVFGGLVTVERGQEGVNPQTFNPGDGVEARLTAGMLSALSEAGFDADAEQIVIGFNATATGSNATAIGKNATSDGGRAAALGDEATASGSDSVAVGRRASAAGAAGVAVGPNSSAAGGSSVAVGSYAGADHDEATALGADAATYAPKSTAVGVYASTYAEQSFAAGYNSYTYTAGSLALGIYAEVSGEAGIAIGNFVDCTVDGGLRIAGISYLPRQLKFNYDSMGFAPLAAQRASQQVVLESGVIDVTDTGSVGEIAMPANTILLPDALDVVVMESDDAGGAPEIQIGPDDVTPAAYLAATPVAKTAVGGRETHTPLVTDGITALRVAVVTAGTGTAYKIKVVVRGYVMEV
ncbi:MAG TPA: hypothetical protein DDZ35_14765 [Halomonas sp.]|nr:hypothetical protein [Halomonas sp.]